MEKVWKVTEFEELKRLRTHRALPRPGLIIPYGQLVSGHAVGLGNIVPR